MQLPPPCQPPPSPLIHHNRDYSHYHPHYHYYYHSHNHHHHQHHCYNLSYHHYHHHHFPNHHYHHNLILSQNYHQHHPHHHHEHHFHQLPLPHRFTSHFPRWHGLQGLARQRFTTICPSCHWPLSSSLYNDTRYACPKQVTKVWMHEVSWNLIARFEETMPRTFNIRVTL